MNKTAKMVEVESKLGEDLESVLKRLYNEEKLSTREVANRLSISYTAARRWLIEAGVEFRSLSESKVLTFSKMTADERREHTSKAKARVDYLRETGQLVVDRSQWTGPNAISRRPEVRRKNSEFQRNWKDRPKPTEEALAKMRRSMEGYLRTKATPQETTLKNALEKLGYFPKFQHAACRAVLDFAFVDLKIGVEIDGKYHASNSKKHIQDRVRDEELEREGWIILRFFNSEIEDELGECLREIIEVVEANKRLQKKVKEAI